MPRNSRLGGTITRPRPKKATADDFEIGRRIRDIRQTKGLSQSDLGRMVNLTFQQIQKYEKGANRAAASTLIRIAAALEVPILDLLPAVNVAGEPPPTPTLTATPELSQIAHLFQRMGRSKRGMVVEIARVVVRAKQAAVEAEG
jgi:transcriptional regulator with XRE-family HTH domain